MGQEVIASILSLSSEQQVLVATAVLLDGREAARYLLTDVNGTELANVAENFGRLDPEIRTALAATILRAALQSLSQPRNGLARGSDDR